MDGKQCCRCTECGHMGLALVSGGETLCGNCASRSVTPCAAPADRPVPMRVLRSAEAQALAWKKKAEALSGLINRANLAGAIGAKYVVKARKVMAGRA